MEKEKKITDFAIQMTSKEANQNKSHFVDSKIKNKLAFEVKGFDFFLEYSNIPDESREKVKAILEETRNLPAG